MFEMNSWLNWSWSARNQWVYVESAYKWSCNRKFSSKTTLCNFFGRPLRWTLNTYLLLLLLWHGKWNKNAHSPLAVSKKKGRYSEWVKKKMRLNYRKLVLYCVQFCVSYNTRNDLFPSRRSGLWPKKKKSIKITIISNCVDCKRNS